jgi:RimJ/RimL family protein N-acetyltransferase
VDLVKITQDNVATACRIQHRLFPGKDINADRDFVNGFLQPERGKEYWLLQVGEDYVGIAGLYSIRLDPETAWLAWFGILPEFRRRGYATEALGLFEARALRWFRCT